MKILKNNLVSIGSKLFVYYEFLGLLKQDPTENEKIINEIRTLECILDSLSKLNVKIVFPPERSANKDLEVDAFFKKNASELFSLIAADRIKAYAKICKDGAAELKKDGALNEAVECEKMFEQLLKETVNFLKTQYEICKERSIALILPITNVVTEDFLEPSFTIAIQKQKSKEIELDF